eukprot:CAMPEP_0116129818 /NCGR_PEP_ID=MMETSP0329-20121206/8124_1 /TAXON_ID=697910 /ORGANISM="Pseudo-nitzschia arenysensis, Strain B593" /LENGTH=156 /DNA_ID=CAMNT_0003624105 /DNA_START=109 /DNA_END=579 /DNA_ORIENTATION=-
MSDDQSTADKIKGIMKKFLSPNSKPTYESFPELVDCVIWIRFILAVVFGIYAGTQGRVGGANILIALNLIAFPPVVYCQSFLSADPESYGIKLLFSGLFQALALAVVIWTYFYTAAHEQEEAVFAAAFGNLLGAAAGDAVLAEDVGATMIPEESEF